MSAHAHGHAVHAHAHAQEHEYAHGTHMWFCWEKKASFTHTAWSHNCLQTAEAHPPIIRWFNMHLHTCCYSQLLNQDALQRQVVAEELLRHAPT